MRLTPYEAAERLCEMRSDYEATTAGDTLADAVIAHLRIVASARVEKMRLQPTFFTGPLKHKTACVAETAENTPSKNAAAAPILEIAKKRGRPPKAPEERKPHKKYDKKIGVCEGCGEIRPIVARKRCSACYKQLPDQAEKCRAYSKQYYHEVRKKKKTGAPPSELRKQEKSNE